MERNSSDRKEKMRLRVGGVTERKCCSRFEKRKMRCKRVHKLERCDYGWLWTGWSLRGKGTQE